MSSTRLALKRLAAKYYRVVPRQGLRRIVLSYHSVGAGPWSTSIDEFSRQIDWLSSHCRLRTLDAILNEPETADQLQVAVTFDDGYQSTLTRAATVLDRVHILPTVFVSTSQVGEHDRTASDERLGYYPGESFLLWSELADLRVRGWRIESHGREHLDLSREAPEVVRDEMTRSKEALETRLGAPCTGFAYPFGRTSDRVKALAAECGYAWAVCSTHGPVTPAVDRYAVPRIDIRNNYTLEDFIAVVRGDWDYLHFVQAARHALRWYR